jgi:hypothetical protein
MVYPSQDGEEQFLNRGMLSPAGKVLCQAVLQAGTECFACKVDPHEGLLLLLYGLMSKIKPYCTVIVDMLR